MIFSKEIADMLAILLVRILVIFTFIDVALIFIVKAKKPLLENKYFDFHRRHGFLKVMISKWIAVLIIIYALLTHQPSSGALAAPIWALMVFDTKLLIDFIKKDVKQKQKQA
jgi:hypothetical protein